MSPNGKHGFQVITLSLQEVFEPKEIGELSKANVKAIPRHSLSNGFDVNRSGFGDRLIIGFNKSLGESLNRTFRINTF